MPSAAPAATPTPDRRGRAPLLRVKLRGALILLLVMPDLLVVLVVVVRGEHAFEFALLLAFVLVCRELWWYT
jgi:hypothetical protein